MLHRFVFGRRNPLSHLLNGFRPVSTNTESGAVDIYVAANRTKFYRTLGIFCLVQSAAWLAFGQYLFRRRKEKLTLEMMKADLNHINVLIANKLESWTPQTLKKIIFRNQKTLSGLPKVDKEELNPEPVEQPIETIEAKVEEKDMQAELKQFSGKVRETFGILEDRDTETQNEDIKTRQIIPYICFIMSAFTFFFGGFIPCRVIRRIYFSIKPSANTAVVLPENLYPVVRVNTYGWFGVLPPRGKLFTTSVSGMRVAASCQEGRKFMNLIIGQHPFTFYLERSQAQFLLPEFFEHLTSTANEQAKK